MLNITENIDFRHGLFFASAYTIKFWQASTSRSKEYFKYQKLLLANHKYIYVHSQYMCCLAKREEIEEGTSVRRPNAWRDCKKERAPGVVTLPLDHKQWKVRYKMCGRKKTKIPPKQSFLHVANNQILEGYWKSADRKSYVWKSEENVF